MKYPFYNTRNLLLIRITIFLVAFFYIAFTFTSCVKDESFEKDPYSLEKRRHRFLRCKINGKEWYHDGFGFYGDRSFMNYYNIPQSGIKGGFVIDMEFQPDNLKHQVLYIGVPYNLKEGNNHLSYMYNVHFSEYAPNHKTYYIDSAYYNNILYIMDIDSVNYIITGQFEFRAITEDMQDTVLITDGEFDWKPYWDL